MIPANISVVLMISKHPLGLKSHVNISLDHHIQFSNHLSSLAAKPLYDFYKELPPRMEVFRTKQTVLECHVNDPNAPVKWFKNGIPLDVRRKEILSKLYFSI